METKKVQSSDIAVVVTSNLHWAPFAYRYLSLLEKNGHQYDLIMWNREGINENVKANLISFNLKDQTNNGSFLKIFKFFCYSKFVKKQLKKKKYKKILFLGTYAGMPALIGRFLIRNYNQNYWVDIRDITYEKFPLFYKMQERIINHSFQTVVSSRGFLEHLPKYDYGFIHNIDPSMNDIVKQYKKIPSSKIRISYIGNLSYWNSCQEMIDLLANDDRFHMNFVGPNYERVEKYCRVNNINNASFHGRFDRQQTVKFYNNTDVIYNLYGNDTTNVRTALSNKLYYCLRFELPILVNSQTFMADIVNQYSIGIVFENSDSFPNKLYEYISSFAITNHDFKAAWEHFAKEDSETIKKLHKYLGNDFVDCLT